MVGRIGLRYILVVVADLRCPTRFGGPDHFHRQCFHQISVFECHDRGNSTNPNITVISSPTTLVTSVHPRRSAGSSGWTLSSVNHGTLPGMHDANRRGIQCRRPIRWMSASRKPGVSPADVGSTTIANWERYGGWLRFADGDLNPANLSPPTFVAGTANLSEVSPPAGRGSGLMDSMSPRTPGAR